MFKVFGILLLSFAFTSTLMVPFIDLLYRLKFRQKKVKSKDFLGRDSLFNEIQGHKVGTPTGGGILIITSSILFSSLFYLLTSFEVNWTAILLFLTLFFFGLIGFYDDARKMIRMRKRSIKVLPAYQKLLIEIFAAGIVAYGMFAFMGIDSISIPILSSLTSFESLHLGIWFIPFAIFVIIATSNAVNISDGLDGLSTGLLLISLTAFWYLSSQHADGGEAMLFIAVMMGALLAFLYFNIYPARLFMGDTGSLALGAMLGVIALMLDQSLVLPIIGAVFVAEGGSSAIQLLSMKYREGKKVFKIAPLHHHLEAIGWDETKVTMRFWLVAALLAFIGLLIASI